MNSGQVFPIARSVQVAVLGTVMGAFAATSAVAGFQRFAHPQLPRQRLVPLSPHHRQRLALQSPRADQYRQCQRPSSGMDFPAGPSAHGQPCHAAGG